MIINDKSIMIHTDFCRDNGGPGKHVLLKKKINKSLFNLVWEYKIELRYSL